MEKMNLGHTTNRGFNKEIGKADSGAMRQQGQLGHVQSGREMNTPSQDMPKKYGTRESAVPPPKG